MSTEGRKLILALVAPLGITLVGLMIGVQELFMFGLVFTGIIFVAAFLRRRQ